MDFSLYPLEEVFPLCVCVCHIVCACLQVIEEAVERMGKRHNEHIRLYDPSGVSHVHLLCALHLCLGPFLLASYVKDNPGGKVRGISRGDLARGDIARDPVHSHQIP